LLALVACDPNVLIGHARHADAGGGAAGTTAPGMDAGSDPPSDAANVDGGRDSGRPDAGADADAGDAGMDAQVDGGPDVEVDAGTPWIGPRSQLSWHSGAHTGNELASQAQFETFRGRPLDLSMYFVDRTQGWPGLVEPTWPIDSITVLRTRIVLSIPLYPQGAAFNNQACAAGDYNSEWEKLGPFLERRGRGDAIIRLGWGPNDSEHYWKADDDPAEWVACYQQVAGSIRRTGETLGIAWDFDDSNFDNSTALDPYLAYPGDEYVDFIGLEAFDMSPPVTTEAEWDAKCNSPTGLCSAIAFARSRGKRVGISEWAIVSCYGVPGGDNPFYVEKMFQTFEANAGVMGFEIYYQNGGEVCSMISDGTTHPEAAARYETLYRRP
jgi:hypothetical protein